VQIEKRLLPVPLGFGLCLAAVSASRTTVCANLRELGLLVASQQVYANVAFCGQKEKPPQPSRAAY
jgi:hypothetical protein